MVRNHHYLAGRTGRNDKSAFTLIELLVVIAIIAILAAILFPVFAQAREKARAISCLSNEKQIGLGVLSYTEDYDEAFPLVSFNYGAPGGDGVTEWTAVVAPYIKNGTLSNVKGATDIGGGAGYAGGIFGCPSAPDPTQGNIYHVRADLFVGSYGLPGTVTWAGTIQLGTQVSVDKPSQKIMMFEGGAYGSLGDSRNPNNWDQPEFFTDSWYGVGQGGLELIPGAPNGGDCDLPNGFDGYWQTCNDFPRYRHNGTSNFLFLDGHVKAIPKGGLKYGRDIYIGRMDESANPPSWYFNGDF